ncbi:sulfatase [Persicobacter psychrovividus]|uniref:Sulfatase n=1 Tax=Persicobacter psychrovividus TaxID=387638 RepID=A0ABM7VJB9_9BACT|nr:sulfatase [Persicobacter psychrovividus]
MKKTIYTLLSAALCLGSFHMPTAQAATHTDQVSQQKRPNILYIMSDDHAIRAISAYKSDIAKLAPTPNIDRLANEGTLFMRNYCANSLCGPSRATVLTGTHSHINGFMANDGKTHFNGNQPTIANILRKNGYQTAVIGKWHLISNPVGFDHWEILHDQGEYNNPDFITKDGTHQEKGYVTSIITKKCENWLDHRDKSKPFFLMMHHKAPHRNWVPDAKNYHLYEDIHFPVPSNYFDDYKGRVAAGKQEMSIARDMYEGHDLKMVRGIDSDSLLYDRWPQVFFGRMTKEEKQAFLDAYRERNNEFYSKKRSPKEIAIWKYERYMQEYLATIHSVDESVGEIYDYLKRNNLLDNTIVVYTSDQGFYTGEHGWFDKRWMYEESYRMPLMIRDPFIKAKGKKINALTQNIDFAPTFLDMCGVKAPEIMQGKSFLGLMDGSVSEKNWRKYLYYHFYEYPGFHSVHRHDGVSDARYKLLDFYQDGNYEMYDLKTDPTEMHNIFGKKKYAATQARLMKALQQQRDYYKVPKKLYSK